jgi:putative lipoic acid-binding regulatory protein
MSKSENQEDFYKRLKAQLEQDVSWPSLYLYKFIVPSKGNGLEEVTHLFNDMGAVISTKSSRNGKYTSISIKVQMSSPDQVIKKYKEVSRVEGIISL